MMVNEVNEYTVSGTFLKKYLLQGDLNVEKINEAYRKVVIETTNVLIAWHSANIISISDAKLLLKAANLEYDKFITEYCLKLKSI
jgi:hypothetical protein